MGSMEATTSIEEPLSLSFVADADVDVYDDDDDEGVTLMEKDKCGG